MTHPGGPQWTRTESAVLREWIKADSKKRPLGAHVNCCDCCYDRNCPCSVYSMCGGLCATSIVLFIIFCCRILAPYHNATRFETATCKTVSSRSTAHSIECCYNPHQTCHRHSCIDVNVTMTTPGGMTINTSVYDGLEALRSKKCSYLPSCQYGLYITKYRIDLFNRSHGQQGSKFTCFYNRQAPQEVVIGIETPSITSELVTLVTVWPLVILFLSSFSIVITFFICGCQPYVYPSRPSPELRAEAYSRDNAAMGVKSSQSLAKRDEEVFRKFYEMQGMPVPPPSSLAATQDGGLLHSPSELQAILDQSA